MKNKQEMMVDVGIRTSFDLQNTNNLFLVNIHDGKINEHSDLPNERKPVYKIISLKIYQKLNMTP